MVAVEHIGTRVIEGGMVARRVGHSEGVIPVRKRKRSCWKDREKCATSMQQREEEREVTLEDLKWISLPRQIQLIILEWRWSCGRQHSLQCSSKGQCSLVW